VATKIAVNEHTVIAEQNDNRQMQRILTKKLHKSAEKKQKVSCKAKISKVFLSKLLKIQPADAVI